jgi:hypothetical protein
MPVPFAQQFTTGDSAIDTALGVGLPIAANVAGNAVAPGLGTVLGGMLKHPLWGAILGKMGSGIIGRFLGDELPYGQFAEEQLSAINQMLPELRTAAAGQPTAASRAITDQVQTAVNRSQQAFATGARRAGTVGGLPGGTAPYRAQQGRVQVAGQQALRQELGANQRAAQQTLAGLAPTAFQHAGITQMSALQRSDDLMGALGRMNRQYLQNQFDPQFQKMMEFLRAYLFETAGQETEPRQTPTVPFAQQFTTGQ